MTTLECALGYLAQGYSFTPVRSRRKEGPRFPWKPYQDRRPTETEVRRWFGVQQRPLPGIGIVTGAISGLVVLDLNRHGKRRVTSVLAAREPARPGDSDGVLSLREEVPGVDPVDYPHVITGGGGIHLYFRHPGFPVKSMTGLFPGVDVQGEGGYIIAPPSIHKSGKEYKWGPTPHYVLPEMPAWLLERLVRP